NVVIPKTQEPIKRQHPPEQAPTRRPRVIEASSFARIVVESSPPMMSVRRGGVVERMSLLP
ncbi:MAG: hypothetical protein NZ823_10975, partial [Blastocatellia bacterium]|nr:hypothetical protein [Blastocatellia bacterium]